MVWAALFAHASGGKLSAAEATVLVLAVWVIYVSDRLLDGWTAKDRAALHERHRFCERHRFVLAGLVAFASGALVWLTTEHLPAAEVTAGVKLGVILVLYMAGIHAGRGRIAWVFPKEIVVGLLFACGGDSACLVAIHTNLVGCVSSVDPLRFPVCVELFVD